MNSVVCRSGFDRESKSPTGGGGVDDFISWVAARWQICSDGARILRNISAGNVHVMSRDRRSQQSIFAGVALGMLALGGPAVAADIALKAPAYKAVYDDEKHINVRLGWAAGAGVEYAFAPHWSVKLEYLYSQFGRADIRFPSGTQYSSTLDFQSLRIGLNRKVDWPGSSTWTPKTELTDPESDRWEIHGQTTYLPQGYPAFRAPYTGTNSFTPAPQAQATWSNSLFLNARLWDGGEVYYNPELLQGFGLNDTVGAAGFPNGEAQKSNFPYPHYNTSRLFLRQTFGFGGEQEELARGPTQLPGKVDVSRLTLQVGNFAVPDIF